MPGTSQKPFPGTIIPAGLHDITHKIATHQRITPEEALMLVQQASPGLLGMLADKIRHEKNGDAMWFIRNFHIEPTNLCIHRCRFCSFRADVTGEAWELSLNEIEKIVAEAGPAEEVHITGGVHPGLDFGYYTDMLMLIRRLRPDLHIKAFSAVEIDDMAHSSGMSHKDVLHRLKDAGLDALPGGGAEIFASDIRKQICPDKADAESYLKIHATAHRLGISTNTTMLYGHIESWEHRIDHLDRIRQLQDETGGLLAFIPLKFRNKNNQMANLYELPLVEDLRLFALARIFLDNVPHIKAYWPMLGKEATELLLAFGVDDIDGTINDSTRIYSLAGAEEQNPVMSLDEFLAMASRQHRKALRRNSLYEILETYS